MGGSELEAGNSKRPGDQVMSDAFFPTRFGEFSIHACEDCGTENLMLVYGAKPGTGNRKQPGLPEPVLVRVHSRCTTGDVFHSLRCDCGEQLEKSVEMIKTEGAGVIIYLDQEGRGIGLVNKIRAYELQDRGLDTVEANHQLGFESDGRTYGIASRMLKKLGVKKIRLITNNPKKIEGIAKDGVEVVERIPLIIRPNRHNEKYLKTKKEKMGHLL